jgi:hypothetical protein
LSCPKCGAKNDDNALFCGECGSPLGVAQTGPQNSQHEEILLGQQSPNEVQMQPSAPEKTGTATSPEPSDLPSAQDTQAADTSTSAHKRKGKWLLLVILAAVVVAAGVFIYMNTGARLADKQVTQGDQYLAGKQYDKAIAAFQQAIKA